MFKKIYFTIALYSGLNWLYSKFSNKKVFIVGFHSVGGSFPKVSIETLLFEKQIEYMKKHGHTFIHFSDLDLLKNKEISKPTIIYFDDGFKDNLTVALPILKKYNATATVFVVPKYSESSDDKYMSWDDIRTLHREGIEVGSHTESHAILTEFSEEGIKNELVSSKKIIEKEINAPVLAFSYPKGRYNEKIKNEVKNAGYKFAITTEYGINSFSDICANSFELKKVAPRVYENMTEFSVRLYSYNLFI